jgi:hypothetical protein
MSTVDQIQHYVQQLPEELQAEILHYAEYLWLRSQQNGDAEETDWRLLSLSSALRDVADEAPLYTEADLKETF